MLKEGDKAIDFTLMDDEGEPFTLSSLRGKKVVLYFYPKDDTPGCTKEACSFRDDIDKIREKGAEVIGVSMDSLKSHKKFKSKYNLPFKLLSDEKGEVSRIYGVLKMKSFYGLERLGIERSTFIIDEEGVIRKVFRKVKVDNHLEEVLSNL
ncbi:MAG: thioredoxin-dependent thiol peroxidase [Nitrososphaerales archaeon]